MAIELTKRIKALQSWCFGAYAMGYDLGQALTLFLPQGLFGKMITLIPDTCTHEDDHKRQFSFKEKAQTFFDDIFSHGMLTPVMVVARMVVGPLIGILFGLVTLIPGAYLGFYQKKHYQDKPYHFATELVKQHSVKTVWGALSMSAMWLMGIFTGWLSAPTITLPALSLLGFTLPSMTLGSIACACLLPLASAMLTVSVLGIANSAKHLFMPWLQLSWSKTPKKQWPYTLQTSVSKHIDVPELQQLLNREFKYESDILSNKYHELQERLGHSPSQVECEEQGLLTRFQLIKEQKAFIKKMKKTKKLPDEISKKQEVVIRQRQFKLKFGV